MLGLGAAMLAAAFGWHVWATKERMFERYGNVPGIFLTMHENGDGTWCERVENVGPPAHYNLFGETWQDSHLRWEDVRVENGTSDFPHRRTGAVEVGQTVCGFHGAGPWKWVYVPEETVIFARR